MAKGAYRQRRLSIPCDVQPISRLFRISCPSSWPSACTNFCHDTSHFHTLDETSDDGKPSIFSALSERLGLVLKAEKVSIDVLVIGHAEKLTAN
jgi:uncharacterized protein (TIGR03435 family)